MDSAHDTPLQGWVAPFGYLRIKECSPLPEAFRRVPRPSSPLGAKASTKCPFPSLENPASPCASTQWRHCQHLNTHGLVSTRLPRKACNWNKTHTLPPTSHASSRCRERRSPAAKPSFTLFKNFAAIAPGSVRTERINAVASNFLFLRIVPLSQPARLIDWLGPFPTPPTDCLRPQSGTSDITRRRERQTVMVEPIGVEPTTSCVQSRRSPD